MQTFQRRQYSYKHIHFYFFVQDTWPFQVHQKKKMAYGGGPTGPPVLAQELEYKTMHLGHGQGNYTRIVSQQGPNQVISPQGGDVTQFQLIPATGNPSDDILSFTVTGPTNVVDVNNWIHNIPPIREMQLVTQGGANIAYVRNFQYAMDMMGHPTTCWLEAEGELPHSILRQKDFADQATGVEPRQGAYTMPGPPAVATPDLIYLGMTSVRADGTYPSTLVTEPTWVISANDDAVTLPKGPSKLIYNLKMSSIPNSFWTIDKTIQFKEVLYLNIIWASLPEYNWTTDDTDRLTSPVSGYADAVPESIQLSDVYYYQKTERMEPIIAALSRQISSAEGLQIDFPYLWNNRQTMLSGPVTTQLTFNISQGRKLLRVWNAIYAAPLTGGAGANSFARFNRSNANAGVTALYDSFYSLMNGAKLNPFDYTERLHEAYNALKGKLEGSCVHNLNQYEHKPFWVDDFTGLRLCDRTVVDDGLALGPGTLRYEINYTMNTTVNTGPYTLMQYATFLRRMVIRDSGITIM